MATSSRICDTRRGLKNRNRVRRHGTTMFETIMMVSAVTIPTIMAFWLGLKAFGALYGFISGALASPILMIEGVI